MHLEHRPETALFPGDRSGFPIRILSKCHRAYCGRILWIIRLENSGYLACKDNEIALTIHFKVVLLRLFGEFRGNRSDLLVHFLSKYYRACFGRVLWIIRLKNSGHLACDDDDIVQISGNPDFSTFSKLSRNIYKAIYSFHKSFTSCISIREAE